MSIFLPEMNPTQEQAVLNSSSAAHHSKAGNSRGECQEKGKLLLIRMLAIWGDGGLSVSSKLSLKIL